MAVSVPIIGGSVLVDEQDVHRVQRHSWHVGDRGYATSRPRSQSGRRRYMLHRLIAEADKGSVVVPRNGDRLDLRRENLEVMTRADMARTKAGKNIKQEKKS